MDMLGHVGGLTPHPQATEPTQMLVMLEDRMLHPENSPGYDARVAEEECVAREFRAANPHLFEHDDDEFDEVDEEDERADEEDERDDDEEDERDDDDDFEERDDDEEDDDFDFGDDDDEDVDVERAKWVTFHHWLEQLPWHGAPSEKYKPPFQGNGARSMPMLQKSDIRSCRKREVRAWPWPQCGSWVADGKGGSQMAPGSCADHRRLTHCHSAALSLGSGRAASVGYARLPADIRRPALGGRVAAPRLFDACAQSRLVRTGGVKGYHGMGFSFCLSPSGLIVPAERKYQATTRSMGRSEKAQAKTKKRKEKTRLDSFFPVRLGG